jgi:nucleoside-diphosphate-sugar epimerase
MSRSLVTGAAGFVGRALCVELLRRGHFVRAALRCELGSQRKAIDGVESVIIGDIGVVTEWRAALTDVEAVVHLAARVHVMRDEVNDPLTAYRAVNTEGTLNLARQAASAGVQRFVYLSSIKVNGEGRDTPYTEADTPQPMDAYAISKWEAEQGLMQIMAQTGLQVVCLRPPLVYGAGVGGNFVRLLHLIRRRIPLPLGAIHNQRDLLYLGNLLDAIVLCINHSCASGKTDLIRDGARLIGTNSFLLPIPQDLLNLFGKLAGKSAEITRLAGSLLIDDDKICTQLGWVPPFSVDAGLHETVEWFLKLSPSEK